MPGSAPDPLKHDHAAEIQWSAVGIGIIKQGECYSYYLKQPNGSAAIQKRICEALDAIIAELQPQ